MKPIRHVFRVAASLDSMVVGEAQILGQVKEAYATARAVGAVRAQLDQLLTRAFAVAKRVRTETAVGSSVRFDRLSRRRIGGERSSEPQRQKRLPGGSREDERVGGAASAGARRCFHFCRQPHLRSRHTVWRKNLNGQAIEFSRLYETCDRADIVITSAPARRTSSSAPSTAKSS
jgi:glutamyl-tRNA reductase